MPKDIDLFRLDGAEQANFDAHLKSFVEKNELQLRAFIMASTSTLNPGDAMRVLRVASAQLASTRAIYDHLDGRRYPVQDRQKYRRKCTELAKHLLSLDFR